jgi:hypothetical protein
MLSYVCVKMLGVDHIMGAKVLVALAAAALGAVAGVAIGYVVFDNSGTLMKVTFIDWLTNRYYVGGRDDAIMWGILGASVAAVLCLLHK